MSDLSDSSDQLLPPHGGYRKLRSFQVAEVVFDATLIFCDRFIEKRSRTYDQMVQAARSGKQNIVEGSVASATSKKTELKLTNVARASDLESTEWTEWNLFAIRVLASQLKWYA